MPGGCAKELQRDKRDSRYAAFAALHSEHAVGVYNLALRLVGNRDDARDITQEVLLKAYQRLGGPRELERAWFYKVTVNACYDYMRRAKVRPQAADDPPEIAAAVDSYEQADLLRQVKWTLRQLSPQQRAALLLREVHGLQYDEMADALGVQPESVGVTLTRARSTFKRHFTAISGFGEAASAAAAAGKRRVAPALNGAGAAAFSFILPGFTLPSAPLPASLEASTLLATATGIGITGGGGAAIGIMAKIAAALSTKAAVVGAGATLVTGSIGGVYAVEKADRSASPEAAPTAVQSSTAPGTAASQVAKPANTGDGSEAAVAKPSPSASPSATLSPSPSTDPTVASPTPDPTGTAVADVPEPSPSATTVGETTTDPSPSATPADSTPTPVPTTVGETTLDPEPSTSPSP